MMFTRKIILIAALFYSLITEAKTINESAEYFAGVNGNEAHIAKMNELWKKYDSLNLQHLLTWRETELNDIKKCTLFYPFSGPDILHPLTFFSNCNTYIMVGLEPAGDVKKLNDEKIDLENLRKGLSSLLNKSFFVTSEMWGDFSRHNNGLVVPLLALIKRMGADITNVEQVYLNNNGDVSTSTEKWNGVNIKFRMPGKEQTQNLYYFGVSLINDPKGMITFIDKQNDVITYLKAAQYALFDYRFANLRKIILDKSTQIIQDDSGIPYKFFDNDKWNRILYGTYQGPYGESFQAYIQKDLLKVYNTSQIKPIPFRLGYGFSRVPTCLMRMVKANEEKIVVSNEIGAQPIKKPSSEQKLILSSTTEIPKTPVKEELKVNTSKVPDEKSVNATVVPSSDKDVVKVPVTTVPATEVVKAPVTPASVKEVAKALVIPSPVKEVVKTPIDPSSTEKDKLKVAPKDKKSAITNKTDNEFTIMEIY